MLDECGIINVLSLFSKIRQSLRNKSYQILPPPKLILFKWMSKFKKCYIAGCFLSSLHSYNLSFASCVVYAIVTSAEQFLKLKEYIARREDKILDCIWN